MKSKLNIDDLAFPYQKPSKEVYTKFKYIFDISHPINERKFKRLLDIFISLILIFICTPIIIVVLILYSFEFLISPKSRGNIFYFYYAVSRSKKFKKFKIRVIKKEYIDNNLSKTNSWGAHKLEWDVKCHTFMGGIIKKFYLDEIPQLFNILLGDMSFIGPRALSEFHYKKDVDQGNVIRKLIKGGLIGYGHIHKGTDKMGDSKYEYEYLNAYIKSSFFSFYMLEFKIIIKSIFLVLKGGGH